MTRTLIDTMKNPVRAVEVKLGAVDVTAAVNLLAKQQVRGHLVNPYLNATADLHAMKLRVEIAAVKSELQIAVNSPEGEMRGFAMLRRYSNALDSMAGLFGGATGYQSIEFVVPNPKDSDSDAVAYSLAEAVSNVEDPLVFVTVPIGSAWCESLLLKHGFTPAGAESVRPPVKLSRSIHAASNAVIRRATAADIDEIVELMVEEYSYHTPFHPVACDMWSPDRFIPTFQASLKTAIDHDDNATVFVAESAGSICGMLYLRTRRVNDPTNPLPTGFHVVIEDISVRASVQGRGIGRSLIEATHAAFQNEPVVAFGVAYSAENPIARRLWPHLGFRAHRRTYVRKR